MTQPLDDTETLGDADVDSDGETETEALAQNVAGSVVARAVGLTDSEDDHEAIEGVDTADFDTDGECDSDTLGDADMDDDGLA